MKKTGQLLKEKREAANLSLSEVALATKINPKVLTAMENGDEAGLPSKTFLKGFLRAYAVFLKMNPEEVLRSYQEESGQPVVEAKRAPEIQKPAATPAANGPRRPMKDENNASLRTAAVIVIVILIGVIIGIRELIEKYQREKQVEASAIKVSPLAQPALVPEGAKTSESAKASESATAAATTSPAGTADTVPTNPATIPAPDMNAQPAPAPTPAPAAAKEKTADTKPVAPPPPSPSSPNPTAVENPPTPAPSALPPPPASNPVPAPPPKAEPAKAEPAKELKADDTAAAATKKSEKVEIILEALDKVDIKFQIKGETKKISLGPTQVHTIHADEPVTLDISDGGAVNVILNGRERGVPGDLGKPKTIKIP